MTLTTLEKKLIENSSRIAAALESAAQAIAEAQKLRADIADELGIEPKPLLAARYEPGKILVAGSLLDLTTLSKEKGINLTGVEIVDASQDDETGGYWIEGGNESKHYDKNGNLDN